MDCYLKVDIFTHDKSETIYIQICNPLKSLVKMTLYTISIHIYLHNEYFFILFKVDYNYIVFKCFESKDLKVDIIWHCVMITGNTFHDLGPNTVTALAPISVKVLGTK